MDKHGNINMHTYPKKRTCELITSKKFTGSIMRKGV